MFQSGDNASSQTKLTNLGYLRLGQNRQLSDISPLSELTTLDLGDNQISDIQSLVDNVGLGRDDRHMSDLIVLELNLLSGNSINFLIPELKSRGAGVRW